MASRTRFMKVTMEVDCTPEEARQFLGLPDLQPMQTAVMAKLENKFLAEIDSMSPKLIIERWMSLVPQNQEQMQGMFTKMFQQSSDTNKYK